MALPFATDGPVCFIPPRVALILERHCKLDALRVEVRNSDPELAQVLYALHAVAMQYDPTSANGSSTTGTTEVAPSSVLMTATDVATHAGCTDHAVRLARREGRLTGTRVGGRWQFEATDVAAWVAARNGAHRVRSCDR